VAESDSDTLLGLEQNSSCRRRTSSNEAKHKMNTIPSHQLKYQDDSPETQWIQTPNAAVRRYYYFLSVKKEQNEKKLGKCDRRSRC
jgi:hypothetical protein